MSLIQLMEPLGHSTRLASSAASLATSAVASTCLVCLKKAVRPSGDPGRLPTSRRW